jgi:hypothetical protein
MCRSCERVEMLRSSRSETAGFARRRRSRGSLASAAPGPTGGVVSKQRIIEALR